MNTSKRSTVFCGVGALPPAARLHFPTRTSGAFRFFCESQADFGEKSDLACIFALRTNHQFSFHRARLSEHIRAHTESPPWKCQDCDHNLKTYQILYAHRLKYHQEGKFVCSRAGCHFIGDVHMDVIHHYKQEHKEPLTTVYRCSSEGCDMIFTRQSDLLSHEKSHNKPKWYRCLWPDCTYDSKVMAFITQHVRINRQYLMPLCPFYQTKKCFV